MVDYCIKSPEDEYLVRYISQTEDGAWDLFIKDIRSNLIDVELAQQIFYSDLVHQGYLVVQIANQNNRIVEAIIEKTHPWKKEKNMNKTLLAIITSVVLLTACSAYAGTDYNCMNICLHQGMLYGQCLQQCSF